MCRTKGCCHTGCCHEYSCLNHVSFGFCTGGCGKSAGNYQYESIKRQLALKTVTFESKTVVKKEDEKIVKKDDKTVVVKKEEKIVVKKEVIIERYPDEEAKGCAECCQCSESNHCLHMLLCCGINKRTGFCRAGCCHEEGCLNVLTCGGASGHGCRCGEYCSKIGNAFFNELASIEHEAEQAVVNGAKSVGNAVGSGLKAVGDGIVAAEKGAERGLAVAGRDTAGCCASCSNSVSGCCSNSCSCIGDWSCKIFCCKCKEEIKVDDKHRKKGEEIEIIEKKVVDKKGVKEVKKEVVIKKEVVVKK